MHAERSIQGRQPPSTSVACARDAKALSSLRRLERDSDGAILVVGIAMGTLMVSALWNIVSVGDAIIWRERLQDTADAAAFENAVWNARGMNVIAFLNIVMSAAMAILVVLRGLVIFSGALLAMLGVATTACLGILVPSGITQFLCALATGGRAPVQSLNTWANTQQASWTPRVTRFLETIANAQVAVATATPLFGVKESITRTTSQYGMAAGGISAALLPSGTGGRPMAGQLPGAAGRLGGAERTSMPRIGRGVSLPVSLDGEWKLCQEAGEFAPNEIFALLEESGFPDWLINTGGVVRSILGGISGNLPALFCGQLSPSDVTELQDVMRSNAENSCRAAASRGRLGEDASPDDRERFGRYQSYFSDAIVVDSQGVADPNYFDAGRCEEEDVARQNRSYEPPRGAKSARVWRYTKNGDGFMASWGFSYDAPPFLAGDDRGLTFADSGRADHLVESEAAENGLARLGSAQAELYHDCPSGSESWGACSEDAMWRMRWKARLRRLRDPRELAARSMANIATAELVNALHRLIIFGVRRGEAAVGDRIIGGGSSGGLLQQAANVLRGNLWDTAAFSRGRVLYTWDPLGAAANRTVGQWLADNPPEPSAFTIH